MVGGPEVLLSFIVFLCDNCEGRERKLTQKIARIKVPK